MVTPRGEWNWDVLKSVLLPPVIKSISTYKKPPSDHNVDDFFGWRYDNKCVFNVRLAYSTICGLDLASRDRIWHHIWHFPVL